MTFTTIHTRNFRIHCVQIGLARFDGWQLIGKMKDWPLVCFEQDVNLAKILTFGVHCIPTAQMSDNLLNAL